MAKKIVNQEDSLFDEPDEFRVVTRSGKVLTQDTINRLSEEAFQSAQANETIEQTLDRWHRVVAECPDAEPPPEDVDDPAAPGGSSAGSSATSEPEPRPDE